jgi:hypothetical protein
MDINSNYLSDLLTVFRQTENSYIQYRDIVAAGIVVECPRRKGKLDSDFLHHFAYLVENGLISNGTPGIQTLRSVGIRLSADNESYEDNVRLRLTQSGTRFAASLSASQPSL